VNETAPEAVLEIPQVSQSEPSSEASAEQKDEAEAAPQADEEEAKPQI